MVGDCFCPPQREISNHSHLLLLPSAHAWFKFVKSEALHDEVGSLCHFQGHWTCPYQSAHRVGAFLCFQVSYLQPLHSFLNLYSFWPSLWCDAGSVSCLSRVSVQILLTLLDAAKSAHLFWQLLQVSSQLLNNSMFLAGRTPLLPVSVAPDTPYGPSLGQPYPPSEDPWFSRDRFSSLWTRLCKLLLRSHLDSWAVFGILLHLTLHKVLDLLIWKPCFWRRESSRSSTKGND